MSETIFCPSSAVLLLTGHFKAQEFAACPLSVTTRKMARFAIQMCSSGCVFSLKEPKTSWRNGIYPLSSGEWCMHIYIANSIFVHLITKTQ